MPSTPPYNVGIIGYGLSAKIFHIPFIAMIPSLHLYAIVQRSPNPDNDASKDHPGVKVYSMPAELIQDPNVNVVVLSTPPDTHFSLAKGALESGKHVIVEKPFTPTHAEAVELIRVAKERGGLLTVFQNRRWDADFLTLQSLLQSNKLGRVVEFETHFDRHRPVVSSTSRAWKSRPIPGGGAIYDLGTHLIDQIVVALGLPKRITGFVTSQRERRVQEGEDDAPDSFTVLLHYENGLTATAKAGVVSPEKEQLRYWIRGTSGSYKKYHLDVQEDQLAAGKRPGDDGFGVEPETNHGILNVVTPDGAIESKRLPTTAPTTYTEFYASFANALQGKGGVPVKPEDAAQVIRLIELAKQSTKEGRTLDV